MHLTSRRQRAALEFAAIKSWIMDEVVGAAS